MGRIHRKFIFDSDLYSVVVENQPNIHICSDYWMSTGKIDPIIINGVATIFWEYLHLKFIGTVFWSWEDDKGQLHSNNLKNVLYFTYSSVNILSATSLAGSMKYGKGTWKLTKIKYSVFKWDFGNHTNTISHS